MTGFLGQKFDFTGEDGAWYCLISDDNFIVNMRVTSPVADLPEVTYITGADTQTFGLHRAHFIHSKCCLLNPYVSNFIQLVQMQRCHVGDVAVAAFAVDHN